MVLTIQQLRNMIQIYLNEWTLMRVDDEILMPSTRNNSDGTVWWSRWDNWLLTPNIVGDNELGADDDGSPIVVVGAIEPLITVENIVLDPYGEPPNYTLLAGESVRTQVTLNTPPEGGTDALVMATFRRGLFTQQFWEANLMGAAAEIGNRILRTQVLDYQAMDYQCDPWHIVVKQAARNALASVQTMLAGLAKVQIEGMLIDMSRSAVGLSDTLNQLGEEVANDLATWRWSHAPPPGRVTPIPGCFRNGMVFQYAWSVP